MTSVTIHAYILAERLHRGQLRKGTSIPYLSHLLGVASLVLEDGGDEQMTSAALLHDAGEDQGGGETIVLIRKECGDRVADLVIECSDSLRERGVTKEPWRQRKEESLQSLPGRSHDALVIIAADKLHNAQATLLDLQLMGPTVWNRFRTGRAGFVWYHDQMSARLQQLLPTSRSVAQLAQTMELLHSQSEG